MTALVTGVRTHVLNNSHESGRFVVNDSHYDKWTHAHSPAAVPQYDGWARDGHRTSFGLLETLARSYLANCRVGRRKGGDRDAGGAWGASEMTVI